MYINLKWLVIFPYSDSSDSNLGEESEKKLDTHFFKFCSLLFNLEIAFHLVSHFTCFVALGLLFK